MIILTKCIWTTFHYGVCQISIYFLFNLRGLGLVGKVDSSDPNQVLLYTHKKFEIGYNGEQIVDVNITTDNKVVLKPNSEIIFTYEVIWKPSSVEFDNRFDKYLDPTFFQHRVSLDRLFSVYFYFQIHWFSIFNSFMMVIFLVGLVWMILLRTLNKDYARYHKDDVESDDADIGEDYGWKQVHGDVFRPPVYPLFFSSIIGTGYHLLSVVLVMIVLAIVAEFYTERGSLMSATIFVYALCAPFNGYFGAGMYSRLNGKSWIKQMVIGALLLPVFVSTVALTVNWVSIYYHASRAIPFTTMVRFPRRIAVIMSFSACHCRYLLFRRLATKLFGYDSGKKPQRSSRHSMQNQRRSTSHSG